MLYLLGWIDISLVKAGELIALELAIADLYGPAILSLIRQQKAGKAKPAGKALPQPRPKRERKPGFSEMLRHLVKVEKMTDADLPSVVSCGGSAIGQLTGAIRPSLADRRNGLAHGDPFEGLPTAGLLELVRDLIDFAYRDYIAKVHALPFGYAGTGPI